MSGGLAGLVSQTLIYPLEITKTRLALCKGPPLGIYACVKGIYQAEGLRGLYRGWQVSALGVVPYAALDMCFYFKLRDLYILKSQKDPSSFQLMLCGSIAGVSAGFITYPLAVLKTKLQSASLFKVSEVYIYI